MKYRWMIVAVSALLIMGLSAFAQEPQGPPPGQGGGQGRRGGMLASPEQRANRLTEQLKLSNEQKAKVQKIYEDAQKDMQGASREDRMAKLQETNEKVKAVLNDEQKKQFEEMQGRFGQRQRPGGPGGEGGQKPPSF